MNFVTSSDSAATLGENLTYTNRSLYLGDVLPSKFYDINLYSMGHTKTNPFHKLKQVAMNTLNPMEDRMQAVRYMNKIPHIDMLKYTLEACISIIEDENHPIGERFFFFSNNESGTKLNDYLMRDCYLHYFKYSIDKKHHPLILRLLTAQYIYMSIDHDKDIWEDARRFIINTAIDTNETVYIRSEAADILGREIIKEDGEIGDDIIDQLGELYVDNKISTIYTNSQNAHNETITESVMSVVKNLAQTYKNLLTPVKSNANTNENENDVIGFTDSALGENNEINNTGHIYEKIIKLTQNIEEQRKDKILSAFNYILVYPAKYEGLKLNEILVLVWYKIQEQNDEIKCELENRLLQELYDMDNTCGTGLLTRLINILSGYIQDDKFQIKMSIKDQLRSNVFARLSCNLKLMPERDQEIILTELATEGSDKSAVKEFLDFYSVKDELYDEFVKTELINEDDFLIMYDKCIRDFIGQ